MYLGIQSRLLQRSKAAGQLAEKPLINKMRFGTSKHPWTLYFSAVIEGNPGYAAIGWVLKDSRDNEIVQKSTFVNENYTRTEAFYIAFIRGLEDAWRRNVAHIIVYGDSGVVCNQVRVSLQLYLLEE